MIGRRAKSVTDFKGRVAAVTGAARGIGRTLAAGLARVGADVALADILYAAPAAARGFQPYADGGEPWLITM